MTVKRKIINFMNKHCTNLQSKIKVLNYAMLIKVNVIVTNAFKKRPTL